jgi:hypothetical protein
MSINDHHVARTSSLGTPKPLIAAVNPSFKVRATLTASWRYKGENTPEKISNTGNSRKYRIGDYREGLIAWEGS